MTNLSTELAGLAAKATPGPWRTAPDHMGDQDYETCIERPGNAGQIGAAIADFHHDWETDRISWKAAQSNAALAVALRNNIPAIIAALKSAETPLGDVAGLVERLRTEINIANSTVSPIRIEAADAIEALARHAEMMEAREIELVADGEQVRSEMARQLAERDAENKRLREELRQIYVDATEQHSDWCNMGPVEDEARDWAFAISLSARQALGGDNG